LTSGNPSALIGIFAAGGKGSDPGEPSRKVKRRATQAGHYLDATGASSVGRTPEEEAYHEVSAYTLMHGDATFIHQHVVDAWAAQHASSDSKPIGVLFALVGLYLHVERGFTGREVQRAHMELAKRPEPWPVGALPVSRGAITAVDVLAAPEGVARDARIHAWAESVWAAYADNREQVTGLLRRRGVI
jgi:hypothetical protein